MEGNAFAAVAPEYVDKTGSDMIDCPSATAFHSEPPGPPFGEIGDHNQCAVTAPRSAGCGAGRPAPQPLPHGRGRHAERARGLSDSDGGFGHGSLLDSRLAGRFRRRYA